MGYVYKILCTTTGEIYVGSTTRLIERWRRHKNELRNNKHHNINLQNAYNRYGISRILYYVLCEYPDSIIRDMEQKYIDELEPAYNIGGVNGGDTFTKNPNKERIRKTHAENLSSMRANGSHDNVDISGSNNPNYRGGISGIDECECGRSKKVRSVRCKTCNDNSRSGSNNSFYGKTHSEETKRKLSNIVKSMSPRNIKKVMVDGVVYDSCKEAAEILGVSNSTITWRVKNRDNYKYV